MNAMIDV